VRPEPLKTDMTAVQSNTFFAHGRGPDCGALSERPVRRAAERKTLFIIRRKIPTAS
jgi:hypothetical protein